MSTVTFADLGLSEPLQRALAAAKYTVPTPIQERTIPALLQGRDVLGIAQTGTGKTAAFALPILQHLSTTTVRAQPKSPRALILAPARELAVQIARSFETYGYGLGLRLCTVVGGLGYGRQIEQLQRGVDILVATPGRLLDLIERGNVKLGQVSFFVLDEADRMFDMGFIRDVRRISQLVSKDRQTLLFSATMPNDIAKLANEILKNPEKVEIAPQGRTVDRIDQRVYFVNSSTKRALLSHLLNDAALEKVIVFTRTKRGANRVAEALEDQGVKSEAIHGNKSQNARQKALDNFTRGKARVLVATDLASRGIDVNGVTHVINFELPADAESYVHRIGRTARAGASGIALSFCDGSERGQLRSIEKLTNQRIAVVPTPSTAARARRARVTSVAVPVVRAAVVVPAAVAVAPSATVRRTTAPVTTRRAAIVRPLRPTSSSAAATSAIARRALRRIPTVLKVIVRRATPRVPMATARTATVRGRTAAITVRATTARMATARAAIVPRAIVRRVLPRASVRRVRVRPGRAVASAVEAAAVAAAARLEPRALSN